MIFLQNINDSLYNLRLIDDLSSRENSINRLHPLVKLLTTVIYITVVVSYGRYEIGGLLALVLYPVVVFAAAELPAVPVLRRIVWVLPLIIGIGIFNPVYDRSEIWIGGVAVAQGWLTFLSLLIKCGLTVVAGILLVATTRLEHLGAALRMIRVPRIFVLQLLLTYRYISLLMEEMARMLRAYSLRAPNQKGVQFKAWGPFAGSLLLRSYDRAQRVYESMCLRGFTGEYNAGDIQGFSRHDAVFLVGWSLFFIVARIYNLPLLLGVFITGVIK